MLGITEVIPLILTCASGIHVETMYPLVRVESSLNPFAIAIVKDKPLTKQPRTKEEADLDKPLTKQPRTKEEAEKVIDDLEARGANYSVGLAQINKVNFKRFGVSGKDLLEPCKNLQVSEKILTECYNASPDKKIGQALSCYYSGNFRYGYVREGKQQTSYNERIISNFVEETKLAVPSVKKEIEEIKTVVAQRNKTRKQEKISVVQKKTEPRKLVKNFASKKDKTDSNSKHIFK